MLPGRVAQVSGEPPHSTHRYIEQRLLKIYTEPIIIVSSDNRLTNEKFDNFKLRLAKISVCSTRKPQP